MASHNPNYRPSEEVTIADLKTAFKDATNGYNEVEDRAEAIAERSGEIWVQTGPQQIGIKAEIFLHSVSMLASIAIYEGLKRRVHVDTNPYAQAVLSEKLVAQKIIQGNIADYLEAEPDIPSAKAHSRLTGIVSTAGNILRRGSLGQPWTLMDTTRVTNGLLAEFKALEALKGAGWLFAHYSSPEQDKKGVDIVVPTDKTLIKAVGLQVKSNKNARSVKHYRHDTGVDEIEIPMPPEQDVFRATPEQVEALDRIVTNLSLAELAA